MADQAAAAGVASRATSATTMDRTTAAGPCAAKAATRTRAPLPTAAVSGGRARSRNRFKKGEGSCGGRG